MEERLPLDIGICLSCSDNGSGNGSTVVLNTNKDHIVPVMACKAHDFLKPFRNKDGDNLAPLCMEDHQKVDRVKLRAFRSGGLVGLVGYIGEQYPRAKNPEQYAIQCRQFSRLFSKVQIALVGLNGHTPPEVLSDYQRTADLIEEYLERWNKGDF